ncbi:hypothetical protein EVAR_25304_1 [Eumeta japonica]|uniref:Uncharacterized protein n=1 Tax=Eumeta variegata TaxID=151549 RepID=A0A4C1VP62_EUMVA|nr:hypothetical protein EVAR_25304_1 [Eumeta japonica]
MDELCLTPGRSGVPPKRYTRTEGALRLAPGGLFYRPESKRLMREGSALVPMTFKQKSHRPLDRSRSIIRRKAVGRNENVTMSFNEREDPGAAESGAGARSRRQTRTRHEFAEIKSA